MTKVTLTFGFILVFSLFSVGISAGLLQNAEGVGPSSKTPDSEMVCRSGQVLVYHINFRKYICTSDSGAASWIRHGIAEPVGVPTPSGGKQLDKADFAKTSSEKIRLGELEKVMEKIRSGERISKGEEHMAKKLQGYLESKQTMQEYWGSQSGVVSTADPTQTTSTTTRTISQTFTSSDDPALGHENHELMLVLPLSENTYVGRLSFSASEPVQYVTLIGPLGPGEDQGQKIWTHPDGSKYALILVDNGLKSGGWKFAGNALALHTMNSDPFTATVSVAYVELPPGVYDRGTVGTGTVQSVPDPGLGHEGHSVAMILPPRDIQYQGGTVAYSASEDVQLMALHGPLGLGDDQGQDTWSLDGDTKYALTLVDLDKDGIWDTFSGNALAFHTMNPDGFTVTYAVGGLH